jgi:hypothetical protein
MPDAKSFLATVKEEIDGKFADAFDALAEVSTDPEKTGDQLVSLRKKVWEVVEKRLKESYRNGQKGTGKKPDESSAPPKVNPFRK